MAEKDMSGINDVNLRAVADEMFRMMNGYRISQALYTVTRLGIADLLADAPQSSAWLAAAVQADPGLLEKVMRLLCGVGVFTEPSPGIFALTPHSEVLRRDTPYSVRARILVGGESEYRVWGGLFESVQIGAPAAQRVLGADYYDYLRQHPLEGEHFNAMMVERSVNIARLLPATYDLTPFTTIVDVGGSYGTLLAALLQRYPHTHGILFEQPHVAAEARARWNPALTDRCTIVDGDLFAEFPQGDLYIFKQILHNWDDEHCIAMLRQCRRAMAAAGKILIIEQVVTPDDSRFILADLHMFLFFGSRKRTLEEYEALFNASGFALARVLDLQGITPMIEAVPR